MIIKAVLIAVLAVVTFPVLRGLYGMGFGRHLYTHHPGKCSVVKRPGTGSEDIQILSSGLAFITTNLILPQSAPKFVAYSEAHGKGSIQVIDLNLPTPEAKVLTMKHGKDFNPDTFKPHGLSVLEDKVKGEHLIYAVSHPPNQGDRVEKFRYSPKTKELLHEKSFFSDTLHVTNDLTVLAEDRFYISNWLYFIHPMLSLLEQIYQLPFGAILFYNGSDFTSVQDLLHGPNGIIHSADKRYIYLSLPIARTVQVYKRESDYDLRLVQEVRLQTALDNFHFSETGGSLFGGCHSVLYKTAQYFENPAHEKAPSQVLRLPLKDGLIVEDDITEEFYDQGDLISGSSVAGVYKNKMLIGSVIHSLAMCDLPKQIN